MEIKDKRFIEVSFPVKEVSEESAREKNIRHGHISTLHIWWARRPLASSRATSYAALIPEPNTPEEWDKKRQFIMELSRWENSLNSYVIEKARKEILHSNGGKLPRVLDCFAGGGSIPLEALRLGCEVHAVEYNPVATLILKCTLEYPQKYGKPGEIEEIVEEFGEKVKRRRKIKNMLLEDVKRWGNWVLEKARKEIERFYPKDEDGSIPVGYIWARTIPCQNPSCNAEIPLMRQFWLAKKNNKKVALYPYVEEREIRFKVVGDDYEPMPQGFDPSKGTISKAIATCPVCVYTIDANTTRKLFQEGKAGQRMVAVVLHKPGTQGKRYRLATEKDMEIFKEAEKYLEEKRAKLMEECLPAPRHREGQWYVYVLRCSDGTLYKGFTSNLERRIKEHEESKVNWTSSRLSVKLVYYEVFKSEKDAVKREKELKTGFGRNWLKRKLEEMARQAGGIDPVPDEELPPKETLGFRVQRYGILKWGDLFNPRQKSALITFTEKVRQVYQKMIEEGYEEEYAKAVVSYLGFGLTRMADYYNSLCLWDNGQERTVHVFGRQALPMVWDYSELNPLSDTVGSWESMAFRRIWKVIENLSQISNSHIPVVKQSSATELPYDDNYFDAVFTDPPYYDNVPYSYLSDFFYVWLKRSIGDLYPGLFMTPLTPKSKEIVVYSHNKGGFEAGEKYFEDMLKKSFQEIYRVLKSGGIATIVYTHKSTSGWETLINSLLDSGLVVTASWPIDTEMKARLRAKESAALASSIYFVCRKIEREETGWLNKVKEEIKRHIHKKLERLWEEGISGADYFIAAIGSAIEIFGKYKKVMDYEGNVITADKLLEYVREIVTDYAVRQILHNGIAGELSPLTRFYLLWRWIYVEAKVQFDDARKLAQSTGIDLEKEWNKGFIKKEKEFIRILGPQDRNVEELEGSNELIDILHLMLLLWKLGNKEKMKNVLAETGYGKKEAFYKVAQAISETLPMESKEKKFLDGFLSGKDKLMSEIKEKSIKKELF
jgi:adenine-specific DNA methylase